MTRSKAGLVGVGLLCAMLFLAGCGGPGSQPSAETRTAGSSTTGSPTISSPPASGNGRLQASELLTGLTTPWGLVPLKDGTLLISERDNKQILRVDGSAKELLRTLDGADPSGEGGLLGLAITADESRVFAYYTAVEDNRIVAMSWNGRSLGEPEVILDGIPKSGLHNGGRIVVGPDGHLYVGTGDASESERAQDKSSLSGKILRVTVNGQPAPENPFGNEVFSFGHRNVQGLTFDEEDRLWASEFGSQEWDELNLVEKGKNYGWPTVSEGSHYNDAPIPRHAEETHFTPPLKFWNPSISPSGWIFYTGDKFEDLKGKGLLGGLSSEALIVLTIQDEKVLDDSIVKTERRIRDVAQMPDGSLLLLTDGNNAKLLRLVPSIEREAG